MNFYQCVNYDGNGNAKGKCNNGDDNYLCPHGIKEEKERNVLSGCPRNLDAEVIKIPLRRENLRFAF